MDNTDIKNNVIITKPIYKQANKGVASGKGFSVGRVLLEKVRPFRFAMLLSLQRKGIATQRLSFKYITALFYNNFCVNSFGVEPVDVNDFANNVAFKIKSLEQAQPYNSNGRISSDVNNIVEVTEYIIEQFKQSHDKYNTARYYGQQPSMTLTDNELLQAAAFRKVYSKLSKEVTSDNYLKISSVNQLLKIIIVLALFYYFIKSV